MMEWDGIVGGCAVVIIVMIIIALGFVSGEVLVWGCDKVGYDVDGDIVRSVWIVLWIVGWGSKSTKEKD